MYNVILDAKLMLAYTFIANCIKIIRYPMTDYGLKIDINYRIVL